MKILICGDSFAADWTNKHPGKGWPNLLANKYEVVNLAQAGCSEYKILKQLKSVDLNTYDQIIVSHTSPYRIYVKEHPIHYNDPLHRDCDLLYADIKEHSIQNKTLKPIVDYFEKYFDVDYAIDIHRLLCKEIEQTLESVEDRVTHIVNIDYKTIYKFKNMINFDNLFASNKGNMNHYDRKGNKEVFETLLTTLKRNHHGQTPASCKPQSHPGHGRTRSL